jgi:hypothetical protein
VRCLALAFAAAITAIAATIPVTRVALPTSIPLMVVVHWAALAFPASVEVFAVVVIGGGPIRALIRRPGPVPVVPNPASALWVPVALDPLIIWAGLRRHAVRSRRRGRLADPDAEAHLCPGGCGWREQHGRNGDCVQKLSHALDSCKRGATLERSSDTKQQSFRRSFVRNSEDIDKYEPTLPLAMYLSPTEWNLPAPKRLRCPTFKLNCWFFG